MVYMLSLRTSGDTSSQLEAVLLGDVTLFGYETIKTHKNKGLCTLHKLILSFGHLFQSLWAYPSHGVE